MDLDGDGLSNRDEILNFSDMNVVDSDKDGLNDLYEVTHGLSAVDQDTDHDGMNDGFEVNNNLNPLLDDSALDIDYDGYSNIKEYSAGTSISVEDQYPGIPGTLKWKKTIMDRGVWGLWGFSIDHQGKLFSVNSGAYNPSSPYIPAYFYNYGNKDEAGSYLYMSQVSGSIADQPVLDNNGTAYVHDGSSIYAIDTTVSPPIKKWASKYTVPNSEGIESGSNLVLSDGYLYYVTDNGYLRRISTNKTNPSSIALNIDSVDATITADAAGHVCVSGWRYDSTVEDYVGRVSCYDTDGSLSLNRNIDVNINDLHSVVFMNDVMLVAGWDGNLRAFNSNYSLIWQTNLTLPDMTYIVRSPIVGPGGKIYVNYNDGVREIDAVTHNQTWFKENVQISAVASDGTIYLVNSTETGGTISAVGVDKGSKWEYPFATDSYNLRIGPDGTVYVLLYSMYSLSDPIELLAISDDTNGFSQSPWPMFGHDPAYTFKAVNTSTNPVVTITAPTVVDYFAGASVSFAATLTNQGSNVLHWYSSIDGPLGEGANLTVPLTGGVHIITAKLENASGVLQTMDNITVKMTTALPELAITSPSDGSIFINTTPVTLTASANHLVEGDISNQIEWVSSLDGSLGTGASVVVSLSIGSHVITAQVTDSAGHAISATRSITVTSASDTDADGMADAWELGMFGTLSCNGTGDFDGDGILDLMEYQNYIALPRDGDVNNNGEVNVADVLLLQRHVLGLIVLGDEQKARVDLYPAAAPDGQLTIQDMLLLQRQILGLH